MKAKLLVLLMAMLVCLCSCDGADGNLGSDLTIPLERIVESLQDGNVGLYESAFPSAFVSGYRKAYGDLSQTIATLLRTASHKNQSDYGESWTVTYDVIAKESLSLEELSPLYTLDRFNTYVYTLPAEEILQVARVTVAVTFEGGLDEERFEITYTLLRMDGAWYLHPMHFGTVLKQD